MATQTVTVLASTPPGQQTSAKIQALVPTGTSITSITIPSSLAGLGSVIRGRISTSSLDATMKGGPDTSEGAVFGDWLATPPASGSQVTGVPSNWKSAVPVYLTIEVAPAPAANAAFTVTYT